MRTLPEGDEEISTANTLPSGIDFPFNDVLLTRFYVSSSISHIVSVLNLECILIFRLEQMV